MGMDFPASSAGVKKFSSLCLPQGMAFVGMGQGSGSFFAVGEAVVASS